MSPRRGGAVAALAAAAAAIPAPAGAHGPPLPEGPERIPRHNLIPPQDRPSYHSRVTAVEPALPGLRARILGNQDLLEVVWRGSAPLEILGTGGEPMFRVSRRGVEVNRHSPSAWRSLERFGRVPVPDYADPRLAPRWEQLVGPGPWRWNEHRAQWMRAQRPEVVGDGSRRRKVLDWAVPVRAGSRTARIRGTLRWVPNPEAVREQRSEVSSPLLSLAIVAAAMLLGAAIGAQVRDRRLGGAPGRSA